MITLTGNWRSSATICRLAATLRPDRTRLADVALADHHDSRRPVFLLPRDEAVKLDAFAALAADAGIAARDRFVLAYASQTLPGAVASARRPPHNRTEALLWALARLRCRVLDKRTRDLADKTLRAALLRFWFTGADTTSATDVHDRFGLHQHHLTRLVRQTVADLPALDLPASDWCAQARKILTELRPDTGHPAPSGNLLSAPPNKGRRTAASLAKIGAMTGALADTRVATVHSVKGDQAEAVLILIPDDERTDQLIQRWTAAPGDAGTAAPDSDEAMRVLYVAVTRARQLVALALPPQHIRTVARMLVSSGVAVKTVG